VVFIYANGTKTLFEEFSSVLGDRLTQTKDAAITDVKEEESSAHKDNYWKL